jgi:hypothetical protein
MNMDDDNDGDGTIYLTQCWSPYSEEAGPKFELDCQMDSGEPFLGGTAVALPEHRRGSLGRRLP